MTTPPLKGKCLTGKAHYSPFAFSVNKKSITKTRILQEIKGGIAEKNLRHWETFSGNSTGFFQYYLQFSDSTIN